MEEISAFRGCERKLGTSMGREQAMTFWQNSLSSSLLHRLHLGKAPRSINSQRASTQWVSSLEPPPERASDRDESWWGCADCESLALGVGGRILGTLRSYPRSCLAGIRTWVPAMCRVLCKGCCRPSIVSCGLLEGRLGLYLSAWPSSCSSSSASQACLILSSSRCISQAPGMPHKGLGPSQTRKD